MIFVVTVAMPVLAQTQPIPPTAIQKQLAQLEAASGGRLGVAAINTANNSSIHYRAHERFPLCSTAKVMTVSAILKYNMTDSHLLAQTVIYKKQDVVAYSPMTSAQLNHGMTIAELCQAAITQSDNTAINLLLKQLGGPAAVTIFARSIGDNSFRLDRNEPQLNSAIPGDLRDTTTPAAMAKSLQQLALGDMLAAPQRQQLQTWLKNNTTGNARIRAGVPKGWLVGDKTGTGDYGATNDIAIIWPPHCPPIVMALYFTQNKPDAASRDDIIAAATKMVVNEWGQSEQYLKLKSDKS